MKFFKKLGIILCLLIISGTLGVLANGGFSDVSADFWGYDSIMRLAAEGTVGGYPDGTFNPGGTVTRAEFVKMLGYTGGEKRAYSDVDSSHWAYNYIVSSGLAADGNGSFLPDAPITRGDTVDLMYAACANGEKASAPSFITAQHSGNADAVSYVYAYGILNGDDGVSLRLSGSLTRAEAAALIVRCKNENKTKINLENTVSNEVLKYVFEGLNLFDDNTYTPQRTFTNGEIARACLRLMNDEYNLMYSKFPDYSAFYSFDDEYAPDIAVMGAQLLGADKATKQFADAGANNQDALTMLVFAFLRRVDSQISFTSVNNYYSDITDPGRLGGYLTLAREKNILLSLEDRLYPKNEITARAFALLCLQFDSVFGTQLNTSTQMTDGKSYDEKSVSMTSAFSDMPQNYRDYVCILPEIPNEIYTAPFSVYSGTASAAAKNYNVAREFRSLFVNQLAKSKNYLKNTYGIDAEFTYYPSLVYDNGTGFSIRARCDIKSAPDGIKYADVFGENRLQQVGEYVYSGESFFDELETPYDVFR